MVSPLAIYLSFKFEASILMARMTGLKGKNKLKTRHTGAKEARVLFARPLAIFNTEEKYPLLWNLSWPSLGKREHFSGKQDIFLESV